MLRKFVCVFAFAALSILNAANSYNVTFYDQVVVNGASLKPGDYKLEIKDNTAIISQGKITARAPVQLETGDKKFESTTVRLNGAKVEEIRLGGTRTRVMFEKSGTATD